jgi:hypothetical protein
MTAVGDPNGQLDIGRVIQQLFSVLGRNFLNFLVLAIILTGLPTLLVGILQLNFLRGGQIINWQTILGGVVSLLAGLILQGTVIYGTVTDLNGRRATLGESLSIGLRSFLPLLGIGILFGVAVACGMILLIVPGIMMLVAWCVAVPAYVVEQTSLFGAFGRSAELTRGNRWRIFALFVLYLVASIIVEALLGVFSTAGSLAAGGTGITFARAIIFTPLISVATALLATTGGAVLYVELRHVRDGVGPAGLAAIFD